MIKKQFFSFSWKSAFISSLYQAWVFYRTPFSSFFFPLFFFVRSRESTVCVIGGGGALPSHQGHHHAAIAELGILLRHLFFRAMKEDTTEEKEEATKKVHFHTRVGNGSVCGEKSRARKSFPCSIRVNIFAPFFDISSQVSPPPQFPLLFAPYSIGSGEGGGDWRGKIFRSRPWWTNQ